MESHDTSHYGFASALGSPTFSDDDFSPSTNATSLFPSFHTYLTTRIRRRYPALNYYLPTLPSTRQPQFEVANGQFISPIDAVGLIAFPNTTVTVRAFLFRDDDLVDNLFSTAPLILLRHGYTATFIDHDFALHTPDHTLLYGTKAQPSNTWRLSLL